MKASTIILIIVGLAVIGGIVYFMSKPSGKKENGPSNPENNTPVTVSEVATASRQFTQF